MNVNAAIKSLRIHQWVKNLLLFVPLIMAHEWHDPEVLRTTIVAFFAFSVCASAVYILNDIVDIESDRAHHTKKNRPFASGQLPVQFGYVMTPLLFAAGLLLAMQVSVDFLKVLLCYVVLTTLYSFKLKKIVLIDIITLATLYSVRIFAGSVAAHVTVSQWLLAFSMFLFFSLACMKRYSELWTLKKNEQVKAHGRGYYSHDIEMIAQFGSSSGYLSILVLAFYVNSEEVLHLYHNAKLLWVICPAFFYWISRVWLLAGRGDMHEDPIVFALKDPASYAVGVFVLGCVFFAL